MTHMRWAVAAVAVAALAVPQRAAADHWSAGAPLAGPTEETLDCLSTGAWREQERDLMIGGQFAGTASECPDVVGTAFAVQRGVDRIRTPFGPVAGDLDYNADTDLEDPPAPQATLALGGGAIAIGYASRPKENQPTLTLRRADGTISAPLALDEGDYRLQRGPLPGLDGAGAGLVVWEDESHLYSRTVTAGGTLGPLQVLAGPVGGPVKLAVGADGRAAVAWEGESMTTVVTGTTAGGLDPATAVSTPHSADSIAVTPDGSAVVADTADRSLAVFSRAAGGPFSAPRTYKIADLAETEQPRIALQDGRATIVYTVHPLQYDSHLADLEALTFDAGTRPGTPLPLPVASSNVTQFAAGPGAAYAITFRAAVLDGTKRSQVEAFTLQPGAGTVPAGVKVSVPRRQSLTLRVTVRCPGPCGVRATDPDTHDGVYYDSSRAFTRAGTHTLRIRVAAGNGFGYPHHVTLRIGVDTPDGQIEATRAVHVR